MQPEKTLQQLEAELATVEKAMRVPGVDQAEMQMYQQGITRIKAAIAAKKKAGAPQPRKGRIFQHPFKRAKNQQTTGTAQTEELGIVSAITSGTIKRVLIKWGGQEDDLILTEGETRSRFTTALRDLAQSRFASQERWEDVKTYVTYAKACTYYLALIEFWGQAPTAQQLDLAPLGAARQQIFLMIRESCEALIA